MLFLSHILYIIVTITLPYSSSSKSVSSVVKKNKNTHYTEICEFPGALYDFWSSSHGTISTVKFGRLWISGRVQGVYTQKKINSKLQISLLSQRFGSLFAPIPLLSWHFSSWFSSLPRDKFTATLKWFILAWGSVAQSGLSQKWFMLTRLRSGHLLAFVFFPVYHTFKLNDIHPRLEVRFWVFFP